VVVDVVVTGRDGKPIFFGFSRGESPLAAQQSTSAESPFFAGFTLIAIDFHLDGTENCE
jgi:hypothetical protein